MAKTEDYKLGEFTYPRGWFMIAAAEEASQTPVALRFFGQDMVLYRGQASGKPILLEAYCPHMGTHLAKNTTSYVVTDRKHVEGDNIRCPYHAWRFGADGQCNEIPYSPAPIPKRACVKSWPVVERAGALWIWHDEEGAEPDYDLPDFADHGADQWVPWTLRCLGELDCHPQEIVDNMTDKAHLEPVHGTIEMMRFENEFDGITVRQILLGGHKTLAGAEPMLNDTWYTGPGILQSIMVGEYPSLMLIAHTPVDDGRIKVWYGLMVKVAHATPTPEDIATARGYEDAGVYAFAQDFEIWGNKRACVHPMIVRGDGPFDKLRIWYRQFYNPRARAEEFQKRVNGRYVAQGTTEAPWENTAA